METQFQNNLNKKRTDWSEYVDPEENQEGSIYSKIETDSGDEYDKNFVTEYPRAMFKKPKLKSGSSRSITKDGEKFYRPMFSQRSVSKHIDSPGIGILMSLPISHRTHTNNGSQVYLMSPQLSNNPYF
jgi:hypothetical protein